MFVLATCLACNTLRDLISVQIIYQLETKIVYSIDIKNLRSLHKNQPSHTC